MGLFKPDLYRAFAIGFALGGLVIALVLGTGLSGDPSLIPAATAAAPGH